MNARMVAAALALAAVSSHSLAAARTQAHIEKVDCSTLVGLEPGAAATCGYLYVPENRADPHSRMIGVSFVRAHSRSPTALPDPVIMIAGGPGGRAFHPGYLQYQPALATRDVIWFDQRGTELGRPALQCPEYDEATRKALLGAIDASALAAARIVAGRTCAQRARAEGADLRGYTSREIVADIETLRSLMGFGQVNLYGTSYGGRVAALMARMYPGSVRSLVLNSPLPVEANYDEYGSAGMQRTLNMVFDGCAIDPACAKAFPDVRKQFYEVVAAAKRSPKTVLVKDAAASGGSVPVLATEWVVANALLDQLYSPYTFELLPQRIDAISRGDVEGLRAIIGVGPSDNALLMRLAVWCNEEYYFENPQAIRRQISAFPEFAGVDQSTIPISTCEAAGFDEVHTDATDNAPVETDKPVLIFAGEYDPATPVSWVSAMTAHMPQARVAVFPSQGHGAGFNNCAWTMAQAFFDAPGAKIDTSCLLSERSPDFARSTRPAE